MKINHNRIKVIDLEINQPGKIIITNEKGALEFSDVSTILVNDVTTGGTDKALSAEMGKNLESNKENINNKVQYIEENKSSISFFPSVKAIYSWTMAKFQEALISGINIKTINGLSILGAGNIVLASTDTSQIIITTPLSISTDTLDSNNIGQIGKNVIIDNGLNSISITVNGGNNFCASYLKHGSGTVTFIKGTGRILELVNSLAVLDGKPGATATISSIGITDYLRISN